ncbi:MAG: S26 family signal peptidase [Methyloligellaceae bacterium]
MMFPSLTQYFILITIMTGMAFLALPSWLSYPPMLVYNGSQSMTPGFYRISLHRPKPGDTVLIRLKGNLADLANKRRYLSSTGLLLKELSAKEGDQVCRNTQRISINGQVKAIALQYDRLGRAMPDWQGCQILSVNQIFVLGKHPASFDGRYFGVITYDQIAGSVRLVWARSHQPDRKKHDPKQ